MKVIINGRFLIHRVTGVERYAREILSELDKIIEPDSIEMAVPPEVGDIPTYKNIKVVKIGKLHNRLWEHFSFPWYVHKNKGVSLNLCNVAPLPAPGIVCIHDVKVKATPQYFSKKFLLWYDLLLGNATKRARKIITVSEFSKSEIVKYFKVNPDKITVIADIITTSSTLLVYVLTLNIGASVLRFGIDKNEKPTRVFMYGAKIDIIACIVLSGGIFLAYLLRVFNWKEYCYIFLWLVFVAETFETLVNQFLRAIDKVQVMAISSILGTILRLSSNIVFLLVFKWGIFGYLISLVIGPAVATVYAMIHIFPLKKDEILPKYEKKLHREMRKYAIPAMFGQLGWWINNSIDKYFVVWLQGAAANGIYSISYKLPSIMSMICNVFGQAWGISAIRDFDKNDKDNFFSNTYELLNCVLVVCCSGLILLNVTISKVLFAKDFFDAWEYAPVLIFAMLFSGLSSFWGGIFNAVKRNEVIAWTTVTAGIINCVLMLY